MAVPQERLDIGTVEVHADHAGYESILTPAALGFLAQLHRRFEATRQHLLQARRERPAAYDAGRISAPTRWRSASPTGPWHRFRPHCRTAASRSPARSSAR